MPPVDVETPPIEIHMRNLTLSGHVGFDSLPDQLVSKSVQNGFIFNIMCIGGVKFKVVFTMPPKFAGEPNR